MKSTVAVLMVSASLALATGPVNAQEALAKSSGCLNCHALDAKKIAPSFKEISAKFKGKADAETMLVAKISAGKEHPASKASPDDVKSLVKWVLAM